MDNKIDVNALPLEQAPIADSSAAEMQPIENKMGIENTLAFIAFMVDAIKEFKEIKSSGKKFSYWDLLKFVPIIKQAYPLIQGFEKIPGELSDKITDAEFAQITDVIKQSGLVGDNSQEVTLDVLQWVVMTKNLIFKDFIK